VRHEPTPAAADAFSRFVSDATVHVAPTLSHARDEELRRFVAYRERACDERLKDNVRTLFARTTYADWSRCMSEGFVRTVKLDEWRNARTSDAILETLRRCTNDAHTLITRTSGIVTMRDGTTLTLDTRDEERERVNALARLNAARRAARRYHNVTLRTAYRGSLTLDGMSLSGETARNRLAPLTAALAFSDTLVTRDGITTPVFARGVVRHDNGNVSPLDTYNAAHFAARHKGR
jgi:hypothetical protein